VAVPDPRPQSEKRAHWWATRVDMESPLRRGLRAQLLQTYVWLIADGSAVPRNRATSVRGLEGFSTDQEETTFCHARPTALRKSSPGCAGRGAALRRQEDRRGRQGPWRRRGHPLPLAQGVRRAGGQPGQAPQGAPSLRTRGCGAQSPTSPSTSSSSKRRLGEPLSPSRRRKCVEAKCVEAVCERLDISERRACRALGQHRSSQRRLLAPRDDEDAFTAAVIGLARTFGRWGLRAYHTGLLQVDTWNVNAARVHSASGAPVPGDRRRSPHHQS